MPLPSGTVKVIIGGTLPGGEQFAYGYQLKRTGATTQFQLDQLAGACTAALKNNFLTAGVRGLIASSVIHQTVTLYLYTGGATASLISQSTGINVAGLDASACLPNQCAQVVTLNTGIPGRSSRGRSYLMPLSCGRILTGTGQISNADCVLLANAFAAMLGAVKASSPEAGLPVVASGTKGSSLPITSVAVDSKVDTQRRRAQGAAAVTRAQAAVA